MKISRELEGPGIEKWVLRTLYLWNTTPYSKHWSQTKKFSYIWHWLVSDFYFNKFGPVEYRFISWITQFYPFSLFYRGSWVHADNAKVKEFRDEIESLARDAGLPILIWSGGWDRFLSFFDGKFTKNVAHKDVALARLQEVFREKYGDVYVQNQTNGFRILVDTRLF